MEEEEENRAKDSDSTDDENHDPILSVIGNMGKYQILMCTIIAFFEVPHAWCMVGQKFSAPKIDHWCAPPVNSPFVNWTSRDWRTLSSPIVPKTGKPDSCRIYDVDFMSLDLHQQLGPDGYNGTSLEGILNQTLETVKCSEWIYDRSTFRDTVVEKWNLVCDYGYYPNLAQSIFFSGVLVGVFVAGVASDRFGRKNTMFSLLCLFIVSGTCAAFANSFELWIISRWFMAFGSLGMKTVKCVIGMEMIGGKWRAIIMIGLYQGGWTLGFLTLPLVSYILPDTKYYQLFVALFAILLLPIYFVLPESPRWLYSVGRKEEAKKVLASILKFNGQPVDMDLIGDKLQSQDEQDKKEDSTTDVIKSNVLDLCRNPAIFFNLLVVSMAWFAVGMMFYGLSIYMPEFDGNTHLLFFLQGLAEVPADLFPIVALNLCGRRWNNVANFILGGTVCMLTAAIPQGMFPYEWPIVVFAMLGKYTSQVGFGICYLFTNELFPTVLRNNALSVSSCFARIGSILAPLIATLETKDPTAPIFVFGCIFFAVGLMQIFLPETLKKKMPNSVQDGEHFLRTHRPCCKSS